MFDAKHIAQIVSQSKAEGWPYPKTFDALQEAGVTTYDVDVEEFRAVYTNGSQQWTEPLPKGFQPLKVAKDFNESALLEALHRRSRKETTYEEFLKDIAEAGVWQYHVDMSTRTVTYWDNSKDSFYVQHIPPYLDKV